MRYKPGHREESRTRLLAAVGRGFRRHGFEGIGVDGLAREAGVTSGAFYGHFPSKTDAFKEALTVGLRELRDGIAQFQQDLGPAWIEAFVDFYLGNKRTCDLGDACALQALTSEVARSGPEVRAAYEAELLEVVDVLAGGLPHPSAADRRSRAWALLSILAGAVTITRGLEHEAVAAKAAKAVKTAAVLIART